MTASAHSVPDRRQQPDVPRVSRDPRSQRSRRQIHQRGLRLRDDAAQAHRGSLAGITSRRRSIWPGRPSAIALVADYKANRTPMPGDLAEQITVGARRVQGARCADRQRRGVRGRRCDRHAGDEGGWQPASTSRSSRATRTSFSSSAARSASSIRVTRAPGSTSTGCCRSLVCVPIRSSTCWR